MTLQDWSTVTTASLTDAWSRIVTFLPNLLGSIVIIIIGVLVANIVKWIVIRVLEAARIQSAFDQLEFAKTLREAKLNSNVALIAGEFMKWVTIIIFLIPSASILGMPQVSNLLNDLILYLPNVGIAVIILFLGALFAEFLGNIVRATAGGLGSRIAGSLAGLSRYVIYIFAGLVALSQLGIAPQIISILITGFVAAAAIALGLAFGLGGKDAAAELIAKIKSDINRA
jgi:small-conductance mechanosensitive channel